MTQVSISEKRFGGIVILRDVSFALEKGETLSIIGPSGVGKSTLLRIVAGLDTDFTGQVSTPKTIGLVFQEPTLLPWRTVLDNLTLIHPSVSENAAREMLARVGLQGRETDWPLQLSLGQQRRLALARAFLGAPDLLILDEPFVSLDATTHDEMVALTKTLIDEHRPALLLVTHDRSEAEALTDRVLSLQGTPASLCTA